MISSVENRYVSYFAHPETVHSFRFFTAASGWLRQNVAGVSGNTAFKMGTEIRINEKVSIIIRRHSAAVVEVYRQGMLVWKKTTVPPSMPHATHHGSPTLRRHVTAHPDGTLC
jgi:hypothetical protein